MGLLWGDKSLPQPNSSTSKAELGKSRWDEGAGTWGWLWMGDHNPRAVGWQHTLTVLSPSTSTSLQGQLPQIPQALTVLWVLDHTTQWIRSKPSSVRKAEIPRAMSLFPGSVSPAGALPGCPGSPSPAQSH